MRFAKLENDSPSYAPRRIRIGSVIVYNPTDAHLLSEGYLPVIETPMPDVDAQHYAEPRWTEENGQIVQTWVLTPLPDEISEAEAYGIIFGGGDT